VGNGDATDPAGAPQGSAGFDHDLPTQPAVDEERAPGNGGRAVEPGADTGIARPPRKMVDGVLAIFGPGEDILLQPHPEDIVVLVVVEGQRAGTRAEHDRTGDDGARAERTLAARGAEDEFARTACVN